MASRGEKNNNPLNINHGDKWRGLSLVQKDPRFCTFTTSFYGFRAGAIILKTFRDKYKKNTLEAVIGKWAPPFENDTEAYIQAVSAMAKIGRKESIWQSKAVLQKVLEGMAVVENGYIKAQWIEDIKSAVSVVW